VYTKCIHVSKIIIIHCLSLSLSTHRRGAFKRKKMRDKRFVTVHRGGPPGKEQHVQLMEWACNCAHHVLPLMGDATGKRLAAALTTARQWGLGEASVGDARNASLGAIAVANEWTDPVAVAVARTIGHAVATAHMADHCLRAAAYALKAVKAADGSMEAEQKWQEEQIPDGVSELLLSALRQR
jgi:hypothetical protein